MLCGSGWSVLDRQEENNHSPCSKQTLLREDHSPNLFHLQYTEKWLLIQVESAYLFKDSCLQASLCSLLHKSRSLTICFCFTSVPCVALCFRAGDHPLIFNAHADICCGARCAAISPYNQMLPQGLLSHSVDKVSGKEVCQTIPAKHSFRCEWKAQNIFSLLEQISSKGPSLHERKHIRTLRCAALLQQLIQAQSPLRAGQKNPSACRTFLFSKVPHSARQSETMIMNRDSKRARPCPALQTRYVHFSQLQTRAVYTNSFTEHRKWVLRH